MRYKFTKLTDKFKGIERKCRGIYDDNSGQGPHYLVEDLPNEQGNKNYICVPVGLDLDDPTKYKKAIDYDALTDVRCPCCGNTYFQVHFYDWLDRQKVHHYRVTLECPCGHAQVIYSR